MLADKLRDLGFAAASPEECTMLFGIGTDRAAANVAGAGLKALVKDKLP